MKFIILPVFIALGGSAAAAQSGQGLNIAEVERIIGVGGRGNYIEVLDVLDQNGYRIVEVSSTLLNRVRIAADNDLHLREVIVSRASGRILRDVVVEWHERNGTGSGVVGVTPIENLLQNHPGGIRIVPQR